MSYYPSQSSKTRSDTLTTIKASTRLDEIYNRTSTPLSNHGRTTEHREVPDYSDGNARFGAESSHTSSNSEPSLHAGSVRTSSKEYVPEITVSHPSHISSKEYEEPRHPYERRPMSPSAQSSNTTRHTRSRDTSDTDSGETAATSILPALQVRGHGDENDMLEPLAEEDYEPGSYDLVAPVQEGGSKYSLETRSEQLFSKEHLKVIFDDPSLLLRFTSFLSSNRPSSIPVLIYYLDAIKALKAISYANAVAEALEPIPGFQFTHVTADSTVNKALEEKAERAFDILAQDDLAAYITYIWTKTVTSSISKRITGTLPLQLREASEGLAEVFCLTDPSREDNPIVFASEEFHRTTQYGMNYVIGRNCRFLQGPKTNPLSSRRLREKINSGQEHCEVFLNYRRDGSPFMNLLMIAPLCDSRGKIRYFIGAQVDVSGLAKECSDLESLERLLVKAKEGQGKDDVSLKPAKDEFQQLSEMLNMQELDTVRRWGGRMHKDQQEEVQDSNGNLSNWNKPRLLIHDASPDGSKASNELGSPRVSGKLAGIYEHYLLVRPYPSLRILFASPSLRVPGILQSPFMNRIGGSSRVREELTQAMADGRGVTAKVRWVTKNDVEGRNRWIHCTPLLGSNGAIGVWMIVIVDDEKDGPTRRFRQAPPVEARLLGKKSGGGNLDNMSLRDFALQHGGESHGRLSESHRDDMSMRSGSQGGSWALN